MTKLRTLLDDVTKFIGESMNEDMDYALYLEAHRILSEIEALIRDSDGTRSAEDGRMIDERDALNMARAYGWGTPGSRAIVTAVEHALAAGSRRAETNDSEKPDAK